MTDRWDSPNVLPYVWARLTEHVSLIELKLQCALRLLFGAK